MNKLVVALALLFSTGQLGCGPGSPHLAPKRIIADGQPYAVCNGIVWIGTDGSTVEYENGQEVKPYYELKFTNSDGADVHLKRIRKVELEDLSFTACRELEENRHHLHPWPACPDLTEDQVREITAGGANVLFREGTETTLSNGHVWTLGNDGCPVRLR